jgi:transcriptional regulator with XRE-family HTH domain
MHDIRGYEDPTPPGAGPDDDTRRLAVEIRKLRENAGLSQERLAALVRFGRDYISKAEAGRRLPSENLIGALDAALGAQGELTRLRLTAWRARQAHRLGLPVIDEPAPPLNRPPTPTADGLTPREDATDRRQLGLIAGLTTITALATDAVRELTTADPESLSLLEVEEDIEQFAAVYRLTPHAVLLPQVMERWVQVDTALRGRTSLTAHARLTAAAGRLSYFLYGSAFDLGDLRSAQRLAMLAGQYGEQTGDTVLLASVAGAQSSIAYYRQDYVGALRVFDTAPPDPPHLRARNAAYRSRVRAALGDVDGARAELDLMLRSVTPTTTTPPGDLPLTDAGAGAFMAAVMTRCEDVAAERWARESVAAHQAAGEKARPSEWGHALLLLASAVAQGRHPAPDEAAELGLRALGILQSHPDHTVFVRAKDLDRDLRPYRSLASVVAFHDRLATLPVPALASI